MQNARLIPADSPLRRLNQLPRFRFERLCLLVVRNEYHVQAECIRALGRLGHRVIELRLGQKGGVVSPSENLQAILTAVVQHRPDMLLSINYTGFDRVNWMSEAIDAVGLPTAIWLVDSPFFMAQGYLAIDSPHATIFSWDKSYLPTLKAHGAERVFHLPLGTCRETFRPTSSATEAPLKKSFVGHTLMILERRWRNRLAPDEVRVGEGYAKELLEKRENLLKLVPHFEAPIDRNALVLAFANMVASKHYRLEQLKAVADNNLHLFGDVDWKNLLPSARHYGPVAYGSDLARVFQASEINVNATNLQMPTTVNQRVFDVPGSGAFLLTDNQEEVAEYYVPGREVVTYSSLEELKDKAAYYLAHPSERKAIVARALARTQAEHTYEHRLKTLIEQMRSLHGKSRTAAKRVSTQTQAQIQASPAQR